MIKKFITAVIIASTALLASLYTVNAENFYIDFDASTGTINNIYNPPMDVYELPTEIDGVKVRKLRLDDGYENELNYVKKLIIPETIEEIESWAYDNTIETIEVKEENPYITAVDGVIFSKDMKTLYNCMTVKTGEYIVPDGVETVKKNAFSCQYDLTKIVFPDTLKTLEGGALFLCYNTEIVISENNPNMTAYEGVLFTSDMKELMYCIDLKNPQYTVPQSVEKIRANAFYNTYIDQIELHDNITEIGEAAFRYSSLKNGVVLPEKLKIISKDLFYSTNVAWVVVPDGAEKINEGAFCTYTNTDIYIPASVNEIAENAFGLTYSYTDQVIYTTKGSTAHQFAQDNGLKYEIVDKTSTEMAEFFIDRDKQPFFAFDEETGAIYAIAASEETVEIPEEINGKKVAFVLLTSDSTYGNMKKMILPDSVTIIGSSIYNNFEIEISDSHEYLTKKDGVIFTKSMKMLLLCDKQLQGEYTIPDGVETISSVAFSRQLDLTRLNIPASVSKIEGPVFLYSNMHLEVNVDEDNQNYIVEDGVLMTKDKKTIVWCSPAKTGSYTVPDETETISDCAFMECAISEINFGKNVKNIESMAFSFCRNLTSVTLPPQLSEIGDSVFFMCDALKEVNIGDNVKTIAPSAFSFCVALEKINIPDSVTKIDLSAFENCEALKEIYIPESVTDIVAPEYYSYNFGGTTDSPIVCTEYNSSAHKLLKEYGLPFRIVGTEKITIQQSHPIMTVDGSETVLDTPALNIDGRVMVPLRAIFEALGAEVVWDGETRTITGTKGDTAITMQIDSLTMTKNGVESSLDVPPQIVGDRTLVPVRAIAESFDCTVDWNGDTRTVTITVK